MTRLQLPLWSGHAQMGGVMSDRRESGRGQPRIIARSPPRPYTILVMHRTLVGHTGADSLSSAKSY